MALTPRVKDNDWNSVRVAIAKLGTLRLGPDASPTFTGLTLSGLTATRLIQTDSAKALTSVSDLTSWVAGTANEIDIIDDGDGTITIGIVNPLIVAKGGTGAATLTDGGILLGSGTGAITALGVATNGQIPIGDGATDPVLATITGTSNQVTVTNGAGSITLALPQDIHTGASPTFTGLTLSGLTAGSVVFAGASGVISQDNSNLFWDDSNDRLGVGTASPARDLEINATQAILRIASAAANSALLEFVESSIVGYVGWDGTNDAIKITAGSNFGTTHLVVDTTGNVGIGLIAPVRNLDISAAEPIIRFTIDNASNGLFEFFENSAIVGYFGWRGSDNTFRVINSNNFGDDVGFEVDTSGNLAIYAGDLIIEKTSGLGIKVDVTTPTFGWRDLLGDQFAKNTGGTKPTLTTYNGAIDAWQFSDGDEAFLTFHIPHDYVPGTDIYLHIHWSQTSTTATGGTIDFKYSAVYAKGHNQDEAAGSFTSTPITASFSSIDINDGGSGLNQYQQHLTELVISAATATAALFDRDDLEPDGVIELTLEMDTNSLTDSVTVLDPFIHYADIHYQSTGIATKGKVPDFYA